MKIEDILDKLSLRRILGVIVFTVLFIFTVFHFDRASAVIGRFIGICKPFLVGLAMAFVLNLLVKLYEDRLLKKLTRFRLWKKYKRGVCILLSIVTIAVLLVAVILLIAPQLSHSIGALVNLAPAFGEKVTDWIGTMIVKYNLSSTLGNMLTIDWSEMFQNFTKVTTNFVGSLFNVTMGVTSGLFSFVVSLVFAIYLLAGKEKLLKNLKCTLYAFLPENKSRNLIQVGRMANQIFHNFVAGQCTEAIILGSLCFLGMTLLRLPYALLVGVFVGVTALIPVFGAYLGGIVGFIIICMVKPISAVYFIIFLVILQQLENNLIYPRVVGTSIGLPGMWVMAAILVCGDLFGFPGILLGVPVFSLIYTLMKETVSSRLRAKNLTEDKILRDER